MMTDNSEPLFLGNTIHCVTIARFHTKCQIGVQELCKNVDLFIMIQHTVLHY